MDDETLERLMLDDALGALSDDARALLEAYLRDHAEHRADWAKWRNVADAAQNAMRPRSVISLPPFPRNRFVFPRPVLAAAAMLLIGIGIGTQFRTAPIAAGPSTPVALAPQAPAVAGVEDFWSQQRFVSTALEAEHHSQTENNWNWSQNENSKSGGKL